MQKTSLNDQEAGDRDESLSQLYSLYGSNTRVYKYLTCLYS